MLIISADGIPHLYYENYLLVSIVLILPFLKKVDKDLNSKTFQL